MEWLYILVAFTAQGDELRSTIVHAEPKGTAAACQRYVAERAASLLEIEDASNERGRSGKVRYHIVGTCMQVYTP